MPRASLQPDLVSLPPVGLSFATGVDILADGDHSLWSDWQSLLLREPAEGEQLREDLGLDKPYSDPICRDGKRYGAFLAELAVRGLIEFVPLSDATSGFFSVAKREGKQRLIIDTRIANTYFRDPPHTDLPGCASFSRIELGSDDVFYLAEADVDNAFHRVLLPPGLGRYFILPSVHARYVSLNFAGAWPRNRENGLVHSCGSCRRAGVGVSTFADN